MGEEIYIQAAMRLMRLGEKPTEYNVWREMTSFYQSMDLALEDFDSFTEKCTNASFFLELVAKAEERMAPYEDYICMKGSPNEKADRA